MMPVAEVVATVEPTPEAPVLPPPACLDIVETLVASFKPQADLIVAAGLVDALASFRGTIFLPTIEAFVGAAEALGLDLE